jgi:hypothetical protein
MHRVLNSGHANTSNAGAEKRKAQSTVTVHVRLKARTLYMFDLNLASSASARSRLENASESVIVSGKTMVIEMTDLHGISPLPLPGRHKTAHTRRRTHCLVHVDKGDIYHSQPCATDSTSLKNSGEFDKNDDVAGGESDDSP